MVLSGHFIQDHATKTAECNYCGKMLSFKSTITNLKTHLRLKHKNAYNTLINTSAEDTSSNLHYENILWEHFVNVNPEDMIARCNHCQEDISYSDGKSELNKHLVTQHEEHFRDITVEDDPTLAVSQEDYSDRIPLTPSSMKTSQNPLWKYFERNQTTWMSKCYLCGNHFSYRTTTSNLKQHLRCKHKRAFKQLCREYKNPKPTSEDPGAFSDSEVSYHSGKSDEDADASLKLNDIWNYFEEDGENARCVICRETMSTEYEELKAHLKENHPKLLLQLIQDKDDSDCGSNRDDDNNTYTEIVYLEQEAEEPKDKVKRAPKAITKRKRERQCSTLDNVPLKQRKVEDNDELSVFIKYITCLLKKLTPEAFSQVQLDIINTILKANSSPSNSCVVDNSSHKLLNSSVPNIIIKDVQSGFSTITVAPKEDDDEQANC